MSKKREFLSAVLCALLMLGAPAHAAPKEVSQEQIVKWRNEGILYYEGKARFIRQNYRRAFELFEKSGGKGDAISLYYLANMYSEGLGVLADEPKARILYLRAAEKGHADSQMLTAVFLIMDGIIENNETKQKLIYTDAVQWLEKAVAQDNMEAHFWLGDMLTKGLGAEKDPKRGRQLLEKSAKNNNGNALAMIAAYYWRGLEGEEKNLPKAHELMHKAYRQGNEQAHQLLQQIEQDMTPEQRETAKKAAEKYDKTHQK